MSLSFSLFFISILLYHCFYIFSVQSSQNFFFNIRTSFLLSHLKLLSLFFILVLKTGKNFFAIALNNCRSLEIWFSKTYISGKEGSSSFLTKSEKCQTIWQNLSNYLAELCMIKNLPIFLNAERAFL